MVSIEKITRKLIQLEEYLELLKEISANTLERFMDNKILIGSAKYYLQVSIKCCLDVANHIIASEKYRAPKDYADTFLILEEKGLLGKDLSNKLRQMTKFRNRLVHLYGEIDNKNVFGYIKYDVDDIKRFRDIVIERYKIV